MPADYQRIGQLDDFLVFGQEKLMAPVKKGETNITYIGRD